MRKLMPIALAILLLGACASPSDGPKVSDIRNASLPNSNERFPVVDLAQAPLGYLPATTADSAGGERGAGLSALRRAGPAEMRLRPGDVIEVTILDRTEEGLMSAADSRALNLGRFTVDHAGFVTLPFVGRQRVVESSAEALRSRIASGLRGSAIDPQVVVTVIEQPSSGVTVTGAVNSAGRFPLSGGGERVLDAIALAGGASGAPGSTSVTLVRGSQRAHAPLSRIASDENQNVFLAPGDQIIVEGAAASFTALGAFKSAGEFEFEPGKLTLAQALSRAGGLLDDRADARHFYVIRAQSHPLPPSLTAAGNGMESEPAWTKPTIYRVNLRDVSNFVLMQQFLMQDGDMLYASNAGMVDFAKLFTVFQKSVPTAAAPQPGS
jgi:polysaccharide biosynthesis/export protein